MSQSARPFSDFVRAQDLQIAIWGKAIATFGCAILALHGCCMFPVADLLPRLDMEERSRKMAAIKYNVPLIAQTRWMSCWFASAAMIARAYRPGTRYAGKQTALTWLWDIGLHRSHVASFAESEGMKVLASASHEFTAESLISTLSLNGPIWAGGRWFGVRHVIVVTGADDVGPGNVFFNDPDGGVEKTGTIPWFNMKRVRGAMMARGYPPRL